MTPRKLVAELDTSALDGLDEWARLDLDRRDPRWQTLTNNERSIITAADLIHRLGQLAGFVDAPARRNIADALRDVAGRYEIGTHQ